MRGRSKLLCVVFLVVNLLITGSPAMVSADTTSNISLEQAIHNVKDNFDIPKEYSVFTSNYQNNNNQPIWSLNWDAGQDPGGNFNAQVDAETGEITSMNTWKSEPSPGSAQIPSISRAEAQEKAVQLLNRLAPQHVSEMQIITDSDQLLPLTTDGPTVYNFSWQRVSQGVPFPDNGATIGISGTDGRPTNYSLNWSKSALPAPVGIIGMDQATQVFSQAGMLNLQYFQHPLMRPLSQGATPPLTIVYQLNHPSGGVIDALTGTPLKPEMMNPYRKDLMGGGGGDMSNMMQNKSEASAPAPTTPLSPEELKEIEKTSKLISQEEAVQAVKKWVEVPATLSLQQASLMSSDEVSRVYSWTLHWGSVEKDGSIQNWVDARVDASSGELLSFDLSDQSTSQTDSGVIDRKGAQALGESFLKQVQAQHFSQVKLDESVQPYWNPQVLTPGQNPHLQYFNYHRIVNGIDFPGNSLNVTVDATKQRIINYNTVWQNLNFPSLSGTLSAQQATAAFLKAKPLTLTYYQEQGVNGPGKIRLVYQPFSPSDHSYWNMIDAKSGLPLDWQGNPVAQQHAFHFNDIEGNFAANEINLLGQAGIFGEYGSSFHPAENITLVSLLRAMLISRDNNPETSKLSDAEILTQARSSGWLKEDMQPGAAVSRDMMAKFMIRYLNLERATHATGVFQLPTADAAAVPASSLSYAALAYGLGIIRGDGTNFDPGHVITRAEAAAALVHTLKVAP